MQLIKDNPINLRKEELQELAGTKKKARIKQWLMSLGVNFLPDVDGFPKVSREIMNKKLNGESDPAPINNKKGDEDALRILMGLK